MVGQATMVQATVRYPSQVGRQVLLQMEQGQSLAAKIPENPRTFRSGVSTREILAGKPDRSRQRIQHSHGFLQTTRTTTPDACKILRPRRASKGPLPRR